MPGFGLAKKAAEVFEQNPHVEGLILDKHGIFTFGDDGARILRAHDRMVTLAEQRLAKDRKAVFASAALPNEHRARRARWRRSCAAPAPCAMLAAKARIGGRSSPSAPATPS